MIGNLVKAEEHLELLRKICLVPCAETGQLEGRIAAYQAAKLKTPSK